MEKIAHVEEVYEQEVADKLHRIMHELGKGALDGAMVSEKLDGILAEAAESADSFSQDTLFEL